MEGLLLHAATKKSLGNFIKQPSHTLAIVGAPGAGKGVTAAHIAAELLSLPVDKLASNPYFRVYQPLNNTTTIETAREISNLITLKTTGKSNIRRVIIIEDAQTMTVEAQNALLKTFEEPPSDTVFIVTLSSTSNILPTILSRLQVISLQPLSQKEVVEHFVKAGNDQAKVKQYYFMSGGLPGLMDALLSDETSHPLVRSVQQAKAILQADSFERLTMADEIVKNKQVHDIVAALCIISRSALHLEASQENARQLAMKRWATVLQLSEEAQQLLDKNAQPKLVLTSLFLEI